MGRPGIITAIGVISIVVASISILASGVLGMWNFGMLMVSSASSRLSAISTSTTSAQVVTAPDEVVSDRGMAKAERRTVIDGFTDARPLTETRRRQLEELLAQNGQDVIGLSGPALTRLRVTANVSSSGRMPTARGGDDGPDFYVIGQGRV
jgi:hypothetical protein